MSLRLIPKLKLILMDGKEYSFLLSAGGIERIMDACGEQDIRLLLPKIDIIKHGVPLLWDAMLDKPDGASYEWFRNNLPADIKGLSDAVQSLFGVSLPDQKENPTGGVPMETPVAPLTQ